MKQFMLALLIGWTTHMLYLDAILIRHHQIVDECGVNEKPEKDGALTCLKYGNDTANRFYGKFFGFYSAIKWNNIVTGPWRPE